ncbi:hypothetical protein COV92_02520 [Candidatus Uhrbacteria bacterium CG11_big_fil_rev_8_21_14_0_20_41_9]|nr:MAG: hypothetical protein COV92_02520 [Candidatus Uhrbacteria bacterium CG11_big_fil_rev_8_21_14_0_20_41_9]
MAGITWLYCIIFIAFYHAIVQMGHILKTANLYSKQAKFAQNKNSTSSVELMMVGVIDAIGTANQRVGKEKDDCR